MVLDKIGKRFSDLSDLPEELKQQLTGLRGSSKEQAIVAVIQKLDGYASINEMIAHLYYDHKISEKRPNLSNKIYRMVKDGVLFPVEQRRGVYASDEAISKSIDASNAGTRLGKVKTLPKELADQINAKSRSGKDALLIDVINDLDGAANMDEIIIYLYREHNIIEKKANLANRVYRMIRDGRLFSIEGKRGVYTTKENLSK